MSGSIGADRILRENVKGTADAYEYFVLRRMPGYKKYAITGSYNAGTKKDHGDIDLVVYIEPVGRTVKDIKKELAHICDASEQCKRFRAGKNKGKKSQIYGSLVTCEVPVMGSKDKESVQVDNMIATSEEEMNFMCKFLNMDALKQTLITALVRVEMVDAMPGERSAIEHDYGIPYRKLNENQETEFVLSMNRLSYRIVTRGEDGREKSREEIWESHSWKDVEGLLSWIDLDMPYEYLLDVTYDVYGEDDAERQQKRICGIMKSMINVGPGEVGTPKGDEKISGIRRVHEMFGAPYTN